MAETYQHACLWDAADSVTSTKLSAIPNSVFFTLSLRVLPCTRHPMLGLEDMSVNKTLPSTVTQYSEETNGETER